MTFYQGLSIALGAIAAILAIDRIYFQRLCKLRHNPIDEAIHRIDKTVKDLYDKFIEHIAPDK